MCRLVPLAALVALAGACSDTTDGCSRVDGCGFGGAGGPMGSTAGATAAGGAAGLRGMAGKTGEAGKSGSGGSGFTSGDCSHPDWPDLKICCGKHNELPGSNCVLPATVDHPCSGEGELQDVKVYRVCCKGLIAVARVAPTNDDEDAGGEQCSEQFSLDPSRVCTQCPNGTCGGGENSCNCPEDCGAP